MDETRPFSFAELAAGFSLLLQNRSSNPTISTEGNPPQVTWKGHNNTLDSVQRVQRLIGYAHSAYKLSRKKTTVIK